MHLSTHRSSGLVGNGWREVREDHSPFVRRRSGLEGVPQEVKLSALVVTAPFGIRALHDLAFVHVELQLAFQQPGPHLLHELFGLGLALAVTDDVVGIPLKRHFAMLPFHPFVKGIVQVQVGQ